LAHGFIDGLDAIVVPTRAAIAIVAGMGGRQWLGHERGCRPVQGCAAETVGFQFVFGDGGRSGVAIEGAGSLWPARGHLCLFIPVRIVHIIFYLLFRRCERHR
jgi:hypothetical protein